jgi:iron complex outermembrane recepter protein
MKIFASKRTKGTTEGQFAFQLSPVAAGCAVFLSLVAGSTSAQETTTTDMPKAEANVVVVKGIRRGIEDAISVKKDSTSIVEAVSAEDIGKLPDSSIAESIARLPGLTAQRVSGRASTISIRGLSGDFSSTLLNGREQASTGDNRSVEYDQYPSELISGVTVYKTNDAGLIGQGLSGTVNLQTVSPLAFGGRTVAINLRGERNSMGAVNPASKTTGSRFSVSYIDQFLNRTLGIAIGYARLDSPGQNQKWNAWGYPKFDSGPYAGKYQLGGLETYANSSDQVRNGLMGVIEYRPNRQYTSTVDLYYSKFNKNEKSNITKTGLGWSGATLSNPTFNGDYMTGGTYTGVKTVLQGNLDVDRDKIFAIGWNNKFKVNELWSAQADISMSKASRDDEIIEAYAGTVGTKDNWVVSNIGPEGFPQVQHGLNYADANIIKLNDAGGWNQDGFVKFPQVTDKLQSVRLSATRELDGPFSSVDFGLNHSKRRKTRQSNEFFMDLKSSPTSVPDSMMLPAASHDFAGLGDVLNYDVQAAFDNLYNLRRLVHQDVFNKDWAVEEKVTTTYAKLNIDTEVASIPTRGNIGLQVVRADQFSDATSANPGSLNAPAPAHGGATYTDVLPSMNLAFSLAHDQVVRVGAGKTLARPRLDDMRASRTASIDTTKLIWSGSGGNPELKPWRANSYDISYEKYFAKQGYVSLAGFYKDLKTYIYKQKVPFDFTGTPTNGLTATSPIGEYDAPINGEGGKLKGVELTLSVPLNLISPMLDGFGTQLSGSNTLTSIHPNGPGTSEPLPGFSKHVSNLTAYYEKYGFSARVSQRYRSDYVGEVSGFGADRALVYIKGEKDVSLQLGYEFDSGSMKGLSVLFQVNNATNSPYETYYTTKDQPKEYQKFGRQFLFGFNYKM